MSKIEFIQNLIEPTVVGLGYQLWGIKLANLGNRTNLQIFIDHEDGIGLKDCEKVAIQLNTLLELESPISGKYQLEISSPGLDREFFNLKQCEKYLNQKVRVQLFHKINEKRKFNAQILKVDLENEKISFLDESNEAIEIDFSLVQKMLLTV